MSPDTQADLGKRFERERSRLFAIAYRMLGSAADAEDMVQEAFLRFERADQDAITAPSAYLATTVTRLSIDHLRKQRTAREQYVGPWLPEPLLTDTAPAADQQVALAESLSLAMLVLMEQLDPVQRAVFLLREVFDFDYAAIAQVVEKDEDNCRQLFHRARQRLAAGKSRLQTSFAEHRRLTQQFIETLATGDMAGLVSLLAEDVVEYSDSGGKVPAARRPLYGPDHVARYFLGVSKKSPPQAVKEVWINGRPGIATYEAGRPANLIQIDVEAGRIVAIYVQRNPDKLSRVPSQA
jgi:RNA polymerase sigma-70 factor (ECF subfamily)